MAKNDDVQQSAVTDPLPDDGPGSEAFIIIPLAVIVVGLALYVLGFIHF